MIALPSLPALLRLDAAGCILMGAALVIAAGPVAALTLLPPTLLLVAGAILFPVAALMLFAAQRPRPALVWLVVGGNTVWTAASLAIVVFGLAPINTLGAVFVIGQAAFAAAFAWMESRRVAIARPKAA